MKKIKAFIPNALTLGNLLCGCMAIILLLSRTDLLDGARSLIEERWSFLIGTRYSLIMALIFLAMLLDFFDGFVARMLGVQSKIGKQLDSLADMVTFGLLPSLMMFWLYRHQGNILNDLGADFLPSLFSVVCLVIALAACYRLAKFNIDTEQTENFKGLATPAMTLFVVGFFHYSYLVNPASKLTSQITLLITSILLSYLMVSNIPLFSLKAKNLSWQANWFRYVLLAVSIGLLICLHLVAFALIIPLYILLSLIARKSFVVNTKS